MWDESQQLVLMTARARLAGAVNVVSLISPIQLLTGDVHVYLSFIWNKL